MSNILITRADNFVWLDVTEKMKMGTKKREEVWLAHELYAVDENDADALLETHEDIDTALQHNERVCIEVGFIPKDFINKYKNNNE